jgi:hypothetical protein
VLQGNLLGPENVPDEFKSDSHQGTSDLGFGAALPSTFRIDKRSVYRWLIVFGDTLNSLSSFLHPSDATF